MPRALRHLLAIAFFALQCISAAYWVRSYQYGDEDTGEAVRLARACVELGECRGTGTTTSLVGLHHGTSWIHLTEHFLRNGGGLSALQTSALVLLMAAGGVSFAIVRRYVSVPAALLVFPLYLPLALVTGRFVVLTNATLLPLPLALYYTCAALCIESGSTLAGAVASVCLAAAMSANLSCAVLIPFHLAIVALFARRSLGATMMAGTVLALAFTLESRESAAALGALATTLPGVLTLLVAVAGVAIAATSQRQRLLQLRRRLASLPVRLRLRGAMKAAIVYFNTVAWVTCIALRGTNPQAHYLAPLIVPWVFLALDWAEQLSRVTLILLSLLGAFAMIGFAFAPFGPPLGGMLLLAVSAVTLLLTLLWVGRCWQRSPAPSFIGTPSAMAFAFALISFAMCVPDRVLIARERQPWPVHASEEIARGLYRAGFTFPQLIGALQGQWFGTLQFMVATLDPDLFGASQLPVDTSWSLLPLMIDPAAVPRTQGVVLTFPIDASRSAIVVQAPTYLDRLHMRTCYSAMCNADASARYCTDRQPERPLLRKLPYFESNAVGERVTTPAKSTCIVYTLPVHTPGTGVAHIVRVAEQWPMHIQIRGVAGVDISGQLPSAEVRLIDDRETSGTLELEVSGYGIGPDVGIFVDPPLIEVSAPNEHLLEPLRSRGANLW